MQIFYAPGITGDKWLLDKGESRHCIRVLRMKKGTPVKLIDGKGNLFEGVISDPDPDECKIDITGVTVDFEKRPWHLHIAISPLKNPERFEWFVEKCVEIGIDEITPVISRNSEKNNVKRERINNIIISAMKQSLKAGLTRLNEISDFSDFVKSGHNGKKLIAHCNTDLPRKTLGSLILRGDNAVIMIGPEGDFTKEEISLAETNGFSGVSLGTSRLRTETAGIAACHSVAFINQ